MSTAGKIGITIGDPTGIGPEIVARTIAEADDNVRQRLMVFCDAPILDRAFTAATGQRPPADLHVVDRGLMSADQAVTGRPSTASGKAQVAYLEAAVAAARGKQIEGLVTAPISKAQARRAGFEFNGHTDFLAERLRSEVAMMFVGPRLKVALATVHMSLVDAIAALDVDGIVKVTRLVVDALVRDFSVPEPIVGIMGLNPHSGEGCLFGREDYEIVVPAVEECRRQVASEVGISGPVVPDVGFREAAVYGKYHALIALYHDQGLIPVKLLDFEDTVNVTLGLPIVRTSPAHGVAYGIAGTGQVSSKSFAAALALAVDMVDRR